MSTHGRTILASLLLVAVSTPPAKPSEDYQAAEAATFGPLVKGGFIAGPGFAVLDDVLEPRLLEVLRARAVEQFAMEDAFAEASTTEARWGTTWLELDRQGAPPAKTPIELLLREYAKIVVGPDGDGGRFAGVDYWLQNRPPEHPKEYHSDTDTLLCRKAEKRGRECRNAALSTVLFLDAGCGGPTLVFNQSFNRFGLVPRVPGEIIIVPCHANRLLAFNGSLYHGVAHPVMPKKSQAQCKGQNDQLSPPRRLTLLANFWPRKSKESKPLRPGLVKPSDEADMADLRSILHNNDLPYQADTSLVRPVTLNFPGTFDLDFDSWGKQEIPSKVRRLWKRGGHGKPGTSWWQRPAWIRYQKVSPIEAQIPPDQRVPSWVLWSGGESPSA